MGTWLHNNVAPFHRTTDQFGFFSNFHRSAVSYGGRYWPTSEHLYQAAKFTDEQIIEEIRQANTPKRSKEIAYNHGLAMRENWDSGKVAVMAEILAAKIYNWHGEALKLFDEADDKTIVEVSYRDDFWGAKPDVSQESYQGRNVLGLLWTAYKDQYRAGKAISGPSPTGWLPKQPSIDYFLVANC